jgi:hypothetical protein
MWPTYRGVIESLVAAHVRPTEMAVIEESLTRVACGALADDKARVGTGERDS